ncbi:MAG TPA: DUF916 domain-containing protein [Acidimicrobiales bacterium]|nr:DUF916 domain-containing protein [Acidimicrobiales bacterium]
MGALLAAAVLALVVLAVPAASAQEGGVNFVAEPVPGSQTDPAGGGFFYLQGDPGAEITQAIGLRNDSAGPLQMKLAAVDASTGQLGGASYALANETPSRTGAWISLERADLTLAAKASAVVSFKVAIPPGGESGHHLAGISISVPKGQGGSAEAGQGQAGASVDVQTRRIIAVQVNLPGPSEPELVIGGVSPAARSDGLYLEIAVENTGQGLTKAKGVINVGTDFQREFDVDTFVPDTSIAYPIKWTADASDGEYPTRVEITYGERTAEWQGTFSVGQKVLEELADRKVPPADPPKADHERGSGVPVPALIGAAVGGAVLVGGGGLVLSRLRRPRVPRLPRG